MLRSNIPNTWAYDTMSKRIATDIFPRIIEDNEQELTFPTSPLRSECFGELNDFLSNLKSGQSGYLMNIYDTGPDVNYWYNTLEQIPDVERNWLDAPWIITEFYFYRKIASVFRYFETGYDMFAKQKFNGLKSAITSINDISSKIPELLATATLSDALNIGIQTSLWGNKIDLSLWPADKKATSSTDTSNNEAGKISYGNLLKETQKYILDDQTLDVVNYILKSHNEGRLSEISIIVDNAGYELFSDLLLGYILLELGLVQTMKYHVKGHPTFVSDATVKDCLFTLDYLLNEGDDDTKALASKLNEYVGNNKIQFIEDLFWCQPTAFWDMPPSIQDTLSTSQLCFVKGDANYRRLLGERDWPLHADSRLLLSYWSTPVCALRTFKAEIGCGITEEKQQFAESQDSKWKVSGRW